MDDSICGVTKGFFRFKCFTVLDGMNLSTTERKTFCQAVQAESTSVASLTELQSAAFRARFTAVKSALSKHQIFCPGRPDVPLRRIGKWTLQRTARWSDDPRGGWVLTLSNQEGSETKTKSRVDPRPPSGNRWAAEVTHWCRPKWRNSCSKIWPAGLKESDGFHDGDLGLKSPTNSRLVRPRSSKFNDVSNESANAVGELLGDW